jgi:hypothetical protein
MNCAKLLACAATFFSDIENDREVTATISQVAADRYGSSAFVDGARRYPHGITACVVINNAIFVAVAATRAILQAMGTPSLFVRAMHTLRLSHRDAAELLNMSVRSSQRWISGGGYLSPDQLCALAVKAYPVDPALAAELAYEARTTLEGLGLVAPPAPVAPPPPRLATEDIIDSVVCAAAEAMGAMPSAVRPALLAACRRARRLGLDMKTVEEALGAAPTS